MKFEWIKLGEIAETSSGGTPSRGNKRFYDGKIPWIKSGELSDGEVSFSEENITDEGLINSSAKLLPEGTLLMAMYGATVGKLGFLTFPATTNQAICAIKPTDELDKNYLFYWLLKVRKRLIEASFGGAQPNISQSVIQQIEVPLVSIDSQRQIAAKLKAQLAEVEVARKALDIQQQEFVNLANASIRQSVEQTTTIQESLGEVLQEVKQGIGENWADYPVLGATRVGLAPAKEPPGKNPHRYKPVFNGTVFYNPMRILIGSIAFVDDDDQPGITSPDYVALRGKENKVDSRWFYYWLRSPYGEHCINSLARGAVRERMLFNRLAEGIIQLPPYEHQVKVSQALAKLKPLQLAVQRQLQDINALPNRLLDQVFNQ